MITIRVREWYDACAALLTVHVLVCQCPPCFLSSRCSGHAIVPMDYVLKLAGQISWAVQIVHAALGLWRVRFEAVVHLVSGYLSYSY